MGDLLGNLVARSFELGEVVAPRPVSLFEPVSAPGWPAFGRHASPEATPGASETQETGVPAPLPAPQPRALADAGRPIERRWPEGGPVPFPTQRQIDDAEHRRQRRLPVRETADPTTPSRPDEGRPDQPASRPTLSLAWSTAPAELKPTVQLNMEDLPPAAASTSERLSRSNEESGASPDTQRRRPALEPIFRREVVERTITTVTSPAPDKAATVIDAPQLLTPPGGDQPSARKGQLRAPEQPDKRPVVAQPQVTPYVEPATPQPAPTTLEEQTPTIHVTIGRVEVRATPPPPAPKKQRSQSPPVMSLDDYLRQRAGGERR